MKWRGTGRSACRRRRARRPKGLVEATLRSQRYRKLSKGQRGCAPVSGEGDRPQPGPDDTFGGALSEAAVHPLQDGGEETAIRAALDRRGHPAAGVGRCRPRRRETNQGSRRSNRWSRHRRPPGRRLRSRSDRGCAGASGPRSFHGRGSPDGCAGWRGAPAAWLVV
jgi:hypothetical protein